MEPLMISLVGCPLPPRPSVALLALNQTVNRFTSCATWREVGLEWLAPILLVLKPLFVTNALSPCVDLTFNGHLSPKKILNTHTLFSLCGLIDQSVGKRRSTPEVVSFHHTLVRAFFYPCVNPIPSMTRANAFPCFGCAKFGSGAKAYALAPLFWRKKYSI